MKELKIISPAKLNLHLQVVGKLADNFHKIITVFERINLCDEITIQGAPDNKIHIKSNQKNLPLNKKNIVFQATELLREKYKIKSGVNIFIKKNIPVASGLGGGSSNAASILLGLNQLWKLNLGKKELIKCAQKLGADVAFFVTQERFAIGLNRGDKIIPIKTKRKFFHVLVVPKITIYAKDIYQKFDKLSLKLTKSQEDVKILSYILKNKDFELFKKSFFSDLEKVTLREYPIVNRIKKKLHELGLKYVAMSGKGPAVFGMVETRKEAGRICNKLSKEGRGRVYLVETY